MEGFELPSWLIPRYDTPLRAGLESLLQRKKDPSSMSQTELLNYKNSPFIKSLKECDFIAKVIVVVTRILAAIMLTVAASATLAKLLIKTIFVIPACDKGVAHFSDLIAAVALPFILLATAPFGYLPQYSCTKTNGRFTSDLLSNMNDRDFARMKLSEATSSILQEAHFALSARKNAWNSHNFALLERLSQLGVNVTEGIKDPLHRLTDYIIKRQRAYVQDESIGRSVVSKASKLFMSIIEAYPKFLNATDEHGKTPLDYLWVNYITKYRADSFRQGFALDIAFVLDKLLPNKAKFGQIPDNFLHDFAERFASFPLASPTWTLLFEQFIASKANIQSAVDAVKSLETTPLAKRNMLAFLLSKGDQVDGLNLLCCEAIKQGDPDTVRMLIDIGKVNVKTHVENKSLLQTCLEAINKEDVENRCEGRFWILKLLLDEKADESGKSLNDHLINSLNEKQKAWGLKFRYHLALANI